MTPMMVVAKQYFKDLYSSPFPSPLYPLIGNPQFSPGLEEGVFKKMGQRNEYSVLNFISRGRWVNWANIDVDGKSMTLSVPGILGNLRILSKHFLIQIFFTSID